MSMTKTGNGITKVSFIRKATAFLLAFCLMVSAVTLVSPVTATAAVSEKVKQDAADAGDLLAEMLEIIIDKYYGEIDVETLLDAALRGMFDVLDEYSEYFSAEEYESFSGALSESAKGFGFLFYVEKTGLRIARVYDGSPAAKAGMMEGDMVVEINGLKLDGKNMTDLYVILNNAIEKSSSLMKVDRNGKIVDINVNAAAFSASAVWLRTIEKVFASVAGVELSDNSKYRYVQLEVVTGDCAADFKKAMDAMKKDGVTRLVLDLRGNPGGYVDQAIEICQMLVSKGTIITQNFGNGEKTVYKSDLAARPFEKIIVLTDGNTASAAEIIASALQDDGAVVIGQNSYGKGVIQAVYEFDVGGGFKITTAEYFRRNGGKINKIGVNPDIKVTIPSFLSDLNSTKPADISSDYLKNLLVSLRFIGVNIGNPDTYNNEVINAVKDIQKQNLLPETGELDKTTLDTINGTVFSYYLNGTATNAKALEALRAK